jgi:hypothetical protein
MIVIGMCLIQREYGEGWVVGDYPYNLVKYGVYFVRLGRKRCFKWNHGK